MEMEPNSAPAESTDKGADLQLDGQQFVTFLVNEELFGVPMSSVREIIRMPSVVSVPMSPPSLEGLANLRGRVLPVIDLRRSFGLAEVEHGDATRVIVTDCGALVGFVVDRVASVVSVDRERIEPAQNIGSTVDTQLITGIIKSQAGAAQKMTVLLDLEKVLSREFAALARVMTNREGLGAREQRTNASAAAATINELQLVSFQVAGQEYAFPIHRVQEIVQVPSGFCQIPNAGSHVLGVMSLRDRLLPIVSLREMFRLPPSAMDEQNRIVVLTLDEDASQNATMVGIVMDRVKEVLRLPQSSVGPLPALLARDGRVREVEAICRLDEGKRLVSVLSVERMFQHEAMAEAVRMQTDARELGPKAEVDVQEQTIGNDDEEQMVVFRVGQEEYGVPIEDVQEILRVAEQFTHVPKSADFIEGLVSLRGAVLPVVDLRRRFGMPAKERDERQRVMVFSVAGVRTGVIVDAVSEVLKVSESAFEPAPQMSEKQAGVIQRVANLERQKRMILVLETGQLFDDRELGELQKAS